MRWLLNLAGTYRMLIKACWFQLFVCSCLVSASSAGEEVWRGADLSYVNELEDCGAVYRVNGKRTDPYEIFASKGANLVRLRLWHTPDWTRYGTLEDVHKSIARARAQGMRVLLDFHYSDDWADPATQTAPAAWRGAHSIDDLETLLYEYTRDVLLALNAENRLPEMVQIGNEVNSGIAHLDEKRDHWNQNPERNVRLLNAGIRAVRDLERALDTRIQVVLHIAQPENVDAWLHAALQLGIEDFEVLGISYYAQWSDVPLSGLGDVVRHLANRYDKTVAVVETAYAWTLDWNDHANNILGQDGLEPGYPANPEGQRRYLTDLMGTVLAAGGLGIIYWEPAWISTHCRTRWGKGSHWENAALFDFRRSELLDGVEFFGYDQELLTR